MEVKHDAQLALSLEDKMDREGVVRSVEIGWADGKGHAMMASRNLVKGDILLKVPKKLFFQEAEIDNLTQKERLIMSLLHERKNMETTLFKEWLALLPERYSTISSWSDEDIESLGTQLRIRQAKQLKKDLQRGYERLSDENITFEEYSWCNGVIDTRGFTGRGDNLLLIPYGDMFNHSPEGNNCFELSNDDEYFTFTCDRSYAKGEEVLLKYNALCGWEQVACYGFIDAQVSSMFQYPLHVPPLTGDLHTATDMDILKQSLLMEGSADCCLTLNGPSAAAMKLLRTRYLSHSDIALHTSLDEVIAATATQVSLENEWNIWAYITTYCKSVLGTHPPRMDEPPSLSLSIREADKALLETCLALAKHRMTTLGKQILLLSEEVDLSKQSFTAALQLSHEVELMRKLDASK